MQHSVRPTFQMMLGAFGALCFAAVVVVLNWVVGRFRKKGWPPRWLAISARVAIVVVAAVGTLGLVYGFFVEPHWVAVEHVRLESDKLRAGTRPIRIVHVSDFHSEGKARCENRLPGIISREHPDLIVFTGDAVNGAEGVPVFNQCMRRIAALAPTFVIHAGDGGCRELYTDTAVIEVDRKAEKIEIGGVQVYVGGIVAGRPGGIPKELRSAPADVLKILLCHRPANGAKAVAGTDVDLCLAGDTHGGQVRLPFYGSAVGTEAERKYLAGLFRVDRTWLYVNRGIGMSGTPVRFGVRPEVTVIEIIPSGETPPTQAKAKETGSIQVKCGSDVEVFVDGVSKGRGDPSAGGIVIQEVTPGEHTIKAVKAGFPAREARVRVEAGKVLVHQVGPFVRGPKIVWLDPKDEKPKGAEPTDVKPRDPAPKRVEPRDTARPDVKVPTVGTLIIESLPSECQIHIPSAGLEKHHKREDLWRRPDVPAGTHQATFTALGRTLTREIRLESGVKIRLLVDFVAGTVTEKQKDDPPQALMLDLGEDVTMKLVLIPPGKFAMGSPASEAGRVDDEGPRHEMRITKPFYIAATEVTKAQFAAFAKDSRYKTDAERAIARRTIRRARTKNRWWLRPGFTQTNDSPATCISWNDALAFCQWLSKRSGRAARLPTEAEWEYACRAGTATAYHWGDDPDNGKGWCNVADQAAKEKFVGWRTFKWSDGYVHTAPVATFRPNAFGLYDMHGNVWEWCSDWYGEKYYAAGRKADPRGPTAGKERVLRGGSWCGNEQSCRSAKRYRREPNDWDYNFGFRVVVALD